MRVLIATEIPIFCPLCNIIIFMYLQRLLFRAWATRDMNYPNRSYPSQVQKLRNIQQS